MMRFADLKFVLPRLPGTVILIGDSEVADDLAWTQDCAPAASGKGPQANGENVDLAVTAPSDLRTALEVNPRMVLVIGGTSPKALKRHGFEPHRYIVRWGTVGPRLILPAETVPFRYLMRSSRPRTGLRRLRNVLLHGFAQAGVPVHWLVPRSAEVTVGLREPPVPELISAARALEEDTGGNWLLQLGEGDPLQRAVFLLFQDDSSRKPSWALKFGRSNETHKAFDREERGLSLAQAAGPITASRTPRHIGRLTVRTLPISLETAAEGRPLHQVLAGNASLRRRRQLVDAVAEWTLRMNLETADPSALQDQRDWLRSLARAAKLPPRQTEEALESVTTLPGVLNHSDLGCWNIMTAGSEFTVLDWESAWRPGPPLWDLAYFLADSLPRLHRVPPGRAATETILELFRGDHTESPRLCRWFRTAARALDLPADSVGAAVLLSWCHHARSPAARQLRLRRAGYGGQSAVSNELMTDWGRLAQQWAVDPVLGTSWSVWRG
jgi:hypothetical protein